MNGLKKAIAAKKMLHLKINSTNTNLFQPIRKFRISKKLISISFLKEIFAK